MSDPATSEDREDILAKIRRSNAETEKFIAEQRKLIAEADNLSAEANKFRRERTTLVLTAGAAFGFAAAAIGGLVTHFLGR